MSKLILSLGAAAATALLAGCGGGTPSTTAGNSSASTGGPAASAYKFSACMRAHGVPNFPDPRVSQSGNQVSVMVGTPPGTKGTPAMKNAQKACAGILPGPTSPAQQAAQNHYHEVHLLAFAECMRQHGITDFPDPTAQGHIGLSTVEAAGIDIHLPSFIAAARACVPVSGGLLTRAAISQATGSGGPSPTQSGGSQTSGG